MMNKYLVWVGIAVVVAVVGGLVWVTFKPAGSSRAPVARPTPLGGTPAPAAGLESLAGNPNQAKGNYVLTAANGKLYVRATVDKWNSQSVSLLINDKKSEVTVSDPVEVLCQPQYITDEGGNRILSSGVYIDLTNYKGTPPQIALAKVKTTFPAGSDIALTAAKIGDSWQADIIIGFGCNL